MEFLNVEVSHIQHALRGMRNAMSGWDKSDTRDDWQRRYDEWHDALRASGWKPEYDRMSREELVALGWKGVDIYRKDG